MKKTILLLVLFCVESLLMAVPTREEIAKARPLVQELIRKDLEVWKRHEKTSEQVGDAAMALASHAQVTAGLYYGSDPIALKGVV